MEVELVKSYVTVLRKMGKKGNVRCFVGGIWGQRGDKRGMSGQLNGESGCENWMSGD